MAQHLYPGLRVPPQASAYGGLVVFILATVCALAGPILYRTLFALAQRKRNHIAAEALVLFERNLILISQLALAFAMLADLLAVASYYRSGALLAALYGIYCGFPSNKRLVLDQRLFRVTTSLQKSAEISMRGNPLEHAATLTKVEK